MRATEIIEKEKVLLNFYNLSGDIINSGVIYFDFKNSRITVNSGRVFKVVLSSESVFKFQKTQVKCIDGIRGLYNVIKENNKPDGLLNCYLISNLIDM